MTTTEKLLEINRYLTEAMAITFDNDQCISCKELALVALRACCPAIYAPVELKKAIALVESI